MNLQRALWDWRDQTAKFEFPPGVFSEYGANLLMADDILQRIVDCAHAGKISTIDDLQKQTRWKPSSAAKHGEQLLSIIIKHRPAPNPHSAALTNPTRYPGTVPQTGGNAQIGTTRDNAQTNTLGTRRRAPPRCTACGQMGHISMLAVR